MPASSEPWIEDLLTSKQGRAWGERLAAAQDDPGVRDLLLTEIRAALPGGAPAELIHDILFGLSARASRQAVPRPPDEPHEVFPTGPDLERQVLRTYPYPLARPYRTLIEEDTAQGAFTFLLRTFEGTLHFLATVALSAYCRGGMGQDECNRRLARRFLKGPWAVGDLLGLLRDTVELAGDCQGCLPYPRLRAYLFRPNGKVSDSYKELAAFVELRNAWAHGSGRTESLLAEILPAQRQRLDRELARLGWLTDWRLLRPTAIDGVLVTRADVLMGDLRERNRELELRLEQRDLHQHGGNVRADKGLLLVADDGRYLPLLPLSLFEVKPRGQQGVYLLQGCQWQGAGRPRRVHKALYVAYDAGLDRHEEVTGELVASRLEQLVKRLEEALSSAEPPPAATPAQDEGPDHSLPEVRIEQEFHLRTFVGRTDGLQTVADWLDRKTEGGYLLLLGPPGQGKSAFMAELARRETQPGRGGCLLHMVKSHANPLRFVPALIDQASHLSGARFGPEAYRGDLADLRNALLGALEAVRAKCGRAVLVLDALDELAGGDEQHSAEACLEFLPPRLPEGVRAVLSCRPDVPLVQALRARLAGLQARPLPPLTEGDFRLLLERRLEIGVRVGLEPMVDFGAVFRRLGGNPLFLRAAVDHIADEVEQAATEGRSPHVHVDDLPRSLDAFFREVYQRKIAGKSGGRPAGVAGRQQAELLKLLCVAREPLSYDDLAGLLAAAGQPLAREDCRDRLDAISQFLLDVGGRFKPWHQGLADYVRADVLGETGLRQTEETFCHWLARPDELRGRYALRHRVSHLLGAGQVSEAATLLTDLSFLESKAQAGLVFELAGNFAAVAAASPDSDPRRRLLRLLEEALRMDIHFIARHPDTLFQCLWNRCWWFDCPEAADHYDAPDGGWPPEGPPWAAHGPRLAPLLEAWRQTKERSAPGFLWLRSLRPPLNHLDTALRMVLQGHAGPVYGVALSPDGRLIASGSKDTTVRVWDAESGVVLQGLRGHDLAVQGVAFSPDGKRVASGSGDGTARVWDLGRGAECLRLTHEDEVWGVAFSPDGSRLATAPSDGTARVWDAANGSELLRLRGHERRVHAVAFRPGGRALATGALDCTVRLWDLNGGQEVLCLRKHRAWVTSVSFSPDGRLLASAGWEPPIRLWDCDRGQELGCLLGHQGFVECLAFLPDGRRLVSAGTDRTLRVWDVTSLKELRCLRGHESDVKSVAVSGDGKSLVTGSRDDTVRLWSADRGMNRARLRGHRDPVWSTPGSEEPLRSITFSADGRLLVSEEEDRTLLFWDAHRGTVLGCPHTRGRVQPDWTLRSAALSPDGQRIALQFSEGTILVWDRDIAFPLFRCEGPAPRSFQFSPDNRCLVAQLEDGTVCAWDATSGLPVPASDWQEPTAAADGGPTRQYRAAARVPAEVGESGRSVARFPVQLDLLTPHPQGRIWAGSVRNYLYLFMIEGADR